MHIAIVYNDLSSVQLLVKHGVDVNKRVLGDFCAPSRSRRHKTETKKGRPDRPAQVFSRQETSQKLFNPQNANPESNQFEISFLAKHLIDSALAHAYYGEYPLAFAAAFGYKEIYDFLIEHGADPNMQDTYGNTVLHMLVIRDRSVSQRINFISRWINRLDQF